jgi:hypothetical protein
MFYGSIWKVSLSLLVLYVVLGVIFWAVVGVLLAEKRRLAALTNLVIGLFFLIFFVLYQLIHQLIHDYTFFVPINDTGDRFDGRNVIALVLAAVLTYVIARLLYDSLKKK